MKAYKANITVKAVAWSGMKCRAQGSMVFRDEAYMADSLSKLDREILKGMFPDYREITSYSVECETTETLRVGNVHRTVIERWAYVAPPKPIPVVTRKGLLPTLSLPQGVR